MLQAQGRASFMGERAVRREAPQRTQKFRGGKLQPVTAIPFLGSEAGVVSQSIFVEMDPIAGRLLTDMTVETHAVFVPAEAIEALKNPDGDLPGSQDVYREKLLAGAAIFPLETEGDITKACGINPKSVTGNKRVSDIVRIGHNAAVNYLRRTKYVKATQLLANNTAITPALISQTILDRLNGVLDPEDRVNGAVSFGSDITIGGIGFETDSSGSADPDSSNANINMSDGTEAPSNTSQAPVRLKIKDVGGQDFPDITATFDSAGGISLTDFYIAEQQDRLTRQMRDLVDKYPQYGEELVARFAHGLSVQLRGQPMTVHHSERIMALNARSGMDGVGLDTMQSDLTAEVNFTVTIPRTEFGGMLYVFVSVKPDEALGSQPHPILGEAWGPINHVADQLAIDPEPTKVRDVYSDCDQADEETIVMYNGRHHLKKTYISYGFTRDTDANDVANKSAIWQLEIPMSVDPDTVIYPETISHYPFADQNADVVTCTAGAVAVISTPLTFGPSPVEELAEIETADIFEDA